MSFMTTQPEALAAAAGSLQGIGSALSAQNAAAAAPTTGVIPAAMDDIVLTEHGATTMASMGNDPLAMRAPMSSAG